MDPLLIVGGLTLPLGVVAAFKGVQTAVAERRIDKRHLPGVEQPSESSREPTATERAEALEIALAEAKAATLSATERAEALEITLAEAKAATLSATERAEALEASSDNAKAARQAAAEHADDLEARLAEVSGASLAAERRADDLEAELGQVAAARLAAFERADDLEGRLLAHEAGLTPGRYPERPPEATRPLDLSDVLLRRVEDAVAVVVTRRADAIEASLAEVAAASQEAAYRANVMEGMLAEAIQERSARLERAGVVPRLEADLAAELSTTLTKAVYKAISRAMATRERELAGSKTRQGFKRGRNMRAIYLKLKRRPAPPGGSGTPPVSKK